MPNTHPAPDHDAWLVQTLQSHREAVLWKLDGLSEFDVRRPLTPTGTNLLGLDTMGRVPHWPHERAHVDVRFVLGHLVAETARHAGHADILREQIDGTAGRFRDRDNLPEVDGDWWVAYLGRVQAAADAYR
jgi:hypothetical protein